MSAVAALLWLPLWFCGSYLLVIGLLGVGSLVIDWHRSALDDWLSAGMFLLLGAFCDGVAASWYRLYRSGSDRSGA